MDLLHKFFHWLWANAEPNKLLLEGTVSALGFLLALLINGWLERKKEEETYDSMLLALHFEATANQAILDTSYRKYFRKGLIIKEFSCSTATQMLGNPLFMKYASDDAIKLVNDYVVHLTLANGYRRVAEPLSLKKGFESTVEPTGWLESVFKNWEALLPSLKNDVKAVMDLTATRPPKTATDRPTSS